MSEVTNVILTFDILENEGLRIDTINEKLMLWDDRQSFKALGNESVGGYKCMEANIYLAAFNHIDISALVAIVMTICWRYPEHVQLFVKGQDDYVFTDLAKAWRDAQ